MTINEWLESAETNKDVLRQFISQFHPCMNTYMRPTAHITAPNAEAACQNVRVKIKSETKTNPLVDFDEAIKNKNWKRINNLLNSVWFGVPETTSCWGYTGFKEAVKLMENLPMCDTCGGSGKYDKEGSDNLDVYEVICDECNGTGVR